MSASREMSGGGGVSASAGAILQKLGGGQPSMIGCLIVDPRQVVRLRD